MYKKLAVAPTIKRKTGKTRPECVVPESLALLLHVSRVAGVAPVHLVKKHNGWTVRAYPVLNYYSYLLIIIIDVLIIVAVASDLTVPSEWTVRMRTDTRCAVWIADVVVVTLTANVGVFNAPAQMTRLIDYVNRIQKINSELKIPNLPPQPDSVQYRMVIGSLCMAVVVMAADFFDITYTTAVETRDLIIAVTYLFYYMSYIMLQLLEIQFITTASYVLSSMKLINFGLNGTLNQRNLDTTTVDLKRAALRSNRVYPRNIIVPTRHVNKIIDSIAVLNNTYSENIGVISKSTDEEIIRLLSLSYGSVCDVIRQVDKNHGIVLLLLLASFLLHLVVTPYNLITSLFDHSSQTFWNKCGKPILQLFWSLFHTIDLIMLIEPCQRTIIEMDLTKELVSHLMCTTKSAYDPVSIELKLFCKRLSLNQVSYAPLKVCTLKRSLIATIFGSIITYLVIIIQL